jgi:lipoprotein NlpD
LRFAHSIRTTLLCCLLLGGCAETGGEGPQGYVVQPHDTLYSIAWRHDLDYRDLARWNNIGPTYRISVGQYLVLSPGRGHNSSNGYSNSSGNSRAGSGSSAKSNGSGGSGSGGSGSGSGGSGSGVGGGGARSAGGTARAVNPAPSQAAASATSGLQTPGAAAASQKWIWPTDAAGGPIAVPGGGILLRGRLGQDVRAASGGRVVYTGSGLRGYGNLIIIKHGESLLSAYAHNREMVVRDGQEVAAGQVIAHMGEGEGRTGEVQMGERSPGDGARRAGVLYFEIRQNGRPIDPLPFLNALPGEAK